MQLYYTDEKNVLMLISLLKKNNIRKVIASPGTTNMSFVTSLQNDKFFQIYSCVDERSACYMACGLAAESGEPVVLTCTGATASRNYISGLTEAFYRKLPILAVTSALHQSKIGNNIPQVIDRRSPLNDIVKLSVQIPYINDVDDELGCNIAINKALLELKHNGGGPVHIDLVTRVSKVFNVKSLPDSRKIDRINYEDDLPILGNKKIAIFVGAHKKWNEELINLVDDFCYKYNAIVLCDRTSNYSGKYKIMPNIICDQEYYKSPLNDIDILLHIGDISGAYINLNVKEVWRINPDGEIRDTFKKLKYVFEMSEETFFKKYNDLSTSINSNNYYLEWKSEFDLLEEKANNINLPFSNLYVAQKTINYLPNNSILHLAILNSLRSWNYFDRDSMIYGYTNTGGFGIDGVMSTLIGASLNNKNSNYYGIIGDLAFFYDMNSLGNRNIGNNLRIILINNGCGTEFHNYSHPASSLGQVTNNFIAADGHFGNKSNELVKNYVENLGFEYISAKNKTEFLSNIEYFTSEKLYNKSIIFEIFTDANNESDALKSIRTLKSSFKNSVKNKLKNSLSPQTKAKIKQIIGK